MRKFLKWFGISLAVLLAVSVLLFIYMIRETKSHSPEGHVTYTKDGYDIEVNYSRPFKKNREIFGGLVPYGEVWRTGANEATTFRTGTDLTIGGEKLPAGKYTLWTIPNRGKWQVIFNRGEYFWGVYTKGRPARDPDKDVLVHTAQVFLTVHIREQFNIDIASEPPILIFAWDGIQVEVPMK